MKKGHRLTHRDRRSRADRGCTEQENEVLCIEETRGEVLPEHIVFGLLSITNSCPVNFMLSSPQAKRQFASMEGCEGMVSVSNRWCAAQNQSLLLYFNMIYYFVPSEKQTAGAGRLQSCAE